MARKNEDATSKDSKVADTPNIPQTPATNKKGLKNAFPTFTPATMRMTRAQAKATAATPIELALPTPSRAKKTKIPPGVGLDQLPSPGNLKLKTTGRKPRRIVDFDALTEGVGALDLDQPGAKGKRKGKATGAKDMAGNDNDDNIVDDDGFTYRKTSARLTKADRTVKRSQRGNPTVEEQSVTEDKGVQKRTTRSQRAADFLTHQDTEDLESMVKSVNAIKDKVPEHVKQAMADSYKNRPINPAVLDSSQIKASGPRQTRSMKRKPSTMLSHTPSPPALSTSNTLEIAGLDPAQDALRSRLLAFKNSAPWALSKKLWEVDEEDVEALKTTINDFKMKEDDGKGEGEGKEVLASMLEVVEKFRAFRDAFDGYLEGVDEVGLGLDWSGDGAGEEEEEDEEGDDESAEESD